MTEIFLASNNKKKMAELETLFCSAASKEVKLFSLNEIGFTDDIEENGTTFEENSYILKQFLYPQLFVQESATETE